MSLNPRADVEAVLAILAESSEKRGSDRPVVPERRFSEVAGRVVAYFRSVDPQEATPDEEQDA